MLLVVFASPLVPGGHGQHISHPSIASHPHKPSAAKQMGRRLVSRVPARKKEAPVEAERGYSQSQFN
jgi:hypothetical protein